MNRAGAKRGFDARTLQDLLYNLRAELANALAALPGERPQWLVLEVTGRYPMRNQKRTLMERLSPLGQPSESVESFVGRLERLARAPWLKGIVLRFESLELNLSTAYALRSAVLSFRRSGKRVVCCLNQLDMKGYYLATAADEVIVPESAEFRVAGLALSVLFMRDALARFGVRFEKLAIEEYKNALDPLVRQDMSPAQREQYEALVASVRKTFVEAVAASRRVAPETVGRWVDEGVTSALQAKDLGMVDRVAYEDEVLSERHKPLEAGSRFLSGRRRPLGQGRVAVIALAGAIVPGRSRRLPLPIPLLGGLQAGSETLIRAFRRAEGDPSTAAIVFYVDSPGGSALASDLIWREVARIARKKPVVAVMGEVAASGGYYVLTHASHVIAAPMTITGSIGVVSGKPVLEAFNRTYGFSPETVSWGRYAELYSSDRSFSDEERALVRRGIAQVYALFTRRVAEGRKLSLARVDELGRGRIWSGQDALERGLVDELGDVALATARARELAGLSERAPTWNVEAPAKLLLPTPDDPSALARALRPFGREACLLLHPAQLRLS